MSKRRAPLLFALSAIFVACSPAAPATPESPNNPSSTLSIRPPATPLLVRDPYLNLWSMADHPADDWPRTWNGRTRPLSVLARIDGTPVRLVGATPAVPAKMPLRTTEIRPARTTFRFGDGGIDLAISFVTPLLPGDGDAMSLPGVFLEWTARATDGRRHDIALSIEAGTALARADENAPIIEAHGEAPGRAGTIAWATASPAPGTAQIYREIDELPDWGALLVAAPVDSTLSINAMPNVLTLEWRMPALADAAETRRAFLAHVRREIVRFDGADCTSSWDPADPGRLAAFALDGAGEWLARIEAHDDRLQSAAFIAGGAVLRDLVTLAARQTFGACESCRTGGRDYLFMKELASGSLIQTADVILPALPAFAFEDPPSLGRMLEPFFDHLAARPFNHPYPPHDLGLYPIVEDDPHFADTPVETAGDLLILAAIHVRFAHDTMLTARHEPLLRGYADFLATTGIDVPEQLSTDDFTGPLAHNATLGLKAAIAVAAFAQIERTLGHDSIAADYETKGRAMFADWRTRADAGDHLRLILDGGAGGWSLKYNLYIDRLLGLGLAPRDLVDREIAFYRRQLRTYGTPLDFRFDYAKADWIAWVAALGTRADADALLAPVARMLGETPERVPFTDLYDAGTAKRPWAFQARPVVGGVYARLLAE